MINCAAIESPVPAAAQMAQELALISECRQLCRQEFGECLPTGKLATIKSLTGNPALIRCGAATRLVKLEAGKEIGWDGK
jgi:hypothetical protein